MKDKKLIFMATPFRSGSALTSRMLNAHSQVGMICDKLKYFTFCYDRYNPLTDDKVKDAYNMEIKENDVYMDWKFSIVTGINPLS